MRLKCAILQLMGPDRLKDVVDEPEIEGVGGRSVQDMAGRWDDVVCFC